MKWQTLRHNGVAFPPEYESRKLTVRIKGQPIELTEEQEEMLMAWAKKKDTPYVHDAVFQKNFLDDFKTTLTLAQQTITLADIDWSELHALADREKTANLSDEEKKQRAADRKKQRDELKAKFGYAQIDGVETEIGAYLVEPPGILMGRGAHPLRGKWKGRVQAEDVTLNLDEDAPVPAAPEGHTWGKIVNKHDAMWIATWFDKLSKKQKYVWLADSSHLRQERDKEKYLKAEKLASGVEKVRDEIRKLMAYEDARSRAGIARDQNKLRGQAQACEEKILAATQVGEAEARRKAENELARVNKELETLEKKLERLHIAEMKKRQLATVCYLIDRLAMRVGDEKDEDEADTVGASTLRVEHVHVGAEKIDFNFLGKDSVLWEKSIPRDEKEEPLARNLRDLSHGKQPNEQIFDKVDSTHINQFLSGIVPGLTAKVFRTYHATTAVRSKLQEQAVSPEAPQHVKDYAARLANLNAAIVCNHKRTPPKNWEENLRKRENETEKLRAAKPDLAKLQAQIPVCERALEKLRAEPPDPAKLQAQILAREEALAKLITAKPDRRELQRQYQARHEAVLKLYAKRELMPKPEDQIKKHQEAQERLNRLLAERYALEATAKEELTVKQATLDELRQVELPAETNESIQHQKSINEAHKVFVGAKKTYATKLKRIKKDIAVARKELAKTSQKAWRDINKRIARAESVRDESQPSVALKKHEARIAKKSEELESARDALAHVSVLYAERVAKAQAALDQARQAPLVAQKNFEERVERATLQLDLAKRTRDYNLGTSLKNYIDPRVYKSWGDYVGYDWKRLYTSALQKKFGWVAKERAKWKE